WPCSVRWMKSGMASCSSRFPTPCSTRSRDSTGRTRRCRPTSGGAIALRHVFDDMFTANDAVSTAIQLTFTFETGFTNVQFLGMAADAMEMGDVEFSTLISSIQTDEARHAQQGEPTLRLLIQHGRKAEAQRLIDVMFWRSWRAFALLTGL